MTKISKALANYEPYYERILPTGSRIICSPAVTDTDEDYLILVTPENREKLETLLLADGWQLGGSLPNQHDTSEPVTGDGWRLNTEHEYVGGRIDHSRVFHSWKRFETPAVYGGPGTEGSGWLLPLVSPSEGPEINLLVTCNGQYFDDFTRATFLSKGLNLKDKADRVMVFEALTRDVWPTGNEKRKKRHLYERYNLITDTFTNTNTMLQQMPMQTVTEVIDNMVNPPILAEQAEVPPGVWLVNWGDSTVETNIPAGQITLGEVTTAPAPVAAVW